MWLEPFRRFWGQHLDALATELARGKRKNRREDEKTSVEGMNHDKETPK